MTVARVIEHNRFNAIHGAAEDCKRQAVNAQWLFEHPDVQGYFYRKATFTDSWLTLTGCDALTDGTKIILEHGSTGEMLVDPDSEVFVSRKAVTL